MVTLSLHLVFKQNLFLYKMLWPLIPPWGSLYRLESRDLDLYFGNCTTPYFYEKLIVVQLLWNLKFIAVARYWSPSQATSIQFAPSCPTSCNPLSIFPWDFPIQMLHSFSFPPVYQLHTGKWTHYSTKCN